MSADLVVDATGRGSRTPVWLEQLGYSRPVADRVEIGLGYSRPMADWVEIRLGYATRCYRLDPGAVGAEPVEDSSASESRPACAIATSGCATSQPGYW